MAEEYKLHIRTTGDPSGAELTQDALEKTAQKGEEIVDAVTRGDRATASFVGKLKQLSPEQLQRVEREFRQLIAAEEEAGRDAAALHAQLQRIQSINIDKQAQAIGGIFAGVTAGSLAAQAISTATAAVGEHLRQSIALADQLDDLAGRAGVASSELQRIGNTAGRNNVSLQGTAEVLSKLRINAQDAIAGSKPLSESFDRLGITVEDLRRLSPDQLLYRIADAVASSNDKGKAYADVVDLMGRGSKDFFAVLEQGAEQIRATGDAIGVFSDETIRDLAAAKDAIGALQNQLTIFAGKTIAVMRDDYRKSVEQFADAIQDWTDLFVGATTNAAEFDKANASVAETAKKAQTQIRDEAEEVGGLGKVAELTADKLKQINASFSDRAAKDLPLSLQLERLQFQIDGVREAASRDLPGTMFRSAAELNAAAQGMTSPAAQARVVALAQRYAQLEDAARALSDTQRKAAAEGVKTSADQAKSTADLVGKLRELSAEAAKPNLPVADRIKLLQQELEILKQIKASEEARVKAANTANPAAANRLRQIDEQLRVAPTGRPEDADARGNLRNERTQLVRETGVGAEGAATAVDATIRATNAALDKLRGSVETEGGKIPPGLEGVTVALDRALVEFTAGLTKTAGAVDSGVPQVVQAVGTLDGTIANGLAGIGGAVNGLAVNTDRRFAKLEAQIQALWRNV